MSGELNGVQRQVQRHFPSAYYNHCVAHRMALCASRSASIFWYNRQTNKLFSKQPKTNETSWF